jgi:hypothetical protein
MDFGIAETGFARGSPPGTTTEVLRVGLPFAENRIVSQGFGCTVGSFPFTYLGLPMGLTKPQVKDYAPLFCRIERRMSTVSMYLSLAGRLQLVNSVISCLPT